MNKKKIIILILSVIVVVIIIVISTQSYIIAFVNRQPITLNSFQKNSEAAINYYQKALETYNKDDVMLINSAEVRQEIKRAVLDKLIEDSLVRQELKKRLKEESEKMVDNKIEEIMKGSDIEKEVEVLYGLSLKEFKKYILQPQARQEILDSRLLLENKNFNDWLKEIKKQARVIILIPGFEWKDEKVIIK